MRRIVAAGHCNWDVTLRVAALPDPDGEARITEQHRGGGGSAANVASGLVGFGLPAGLLGSVGDDDQGRRALAELEATGVDTDGVLVVPDGETTVKYLIVDADGEVMVLANDGVNEALRPKDLDRAVLAGADHVHLTGQRPETAARLIDLAQAAAVTVSFDPGRRVQERAFEPLFDRVDALLLNEPEAAAVFGHADDERLAQAAGPDREIVLKRGGEGAAVYTNEKAHTHPGYDVTVRDTTGAGDAFAAGYLAATVGDLELSLPGLSWPERALAVANASGALAVTRPGARAAPNLEELRTFLAAGLE